ncbi:MAG: M28 family peptidase [Hyphomicrobiaceae bacterium]|nr:M28 family peptidase [Hyphomicrobiaceae bacterium]
MMDDVSSEVSRSEDLMRDFDAICDTGGRFAGSDSEQLAQDYLVGRLEAATGVMPMRSAVKYMGWSCGKSILEQLGVADGVVTCVSLVRSPPTAAGGLVADLVDLGRGTEADFDARADEIAGKIVLVRHEYMFATDTIHRRRKYQWAMDHGAAGFLIANSLPGAGPVTGSSGATAEQGIPAAGISFETAEKLTADSPAKVRLVVEAEEAPRETANLIVDLPGKSAEWIVLSAHIDGHHLAESAMDNATGLAAALAIASALAPRMDHMARGLRIALFTVEEWALAGSRVYVDGLDEVERAAIKLNLNLDTIAGSPNLTALTSEFPQLEAWLLECAGTLGCALGTHQPVMANSDHYNFARHGIPATRLVAGFNEPTSEIRHVLTPGDTRDRVQADDLRHATAFAAALTLEACRAETLELR